MRFEKQTLTGLIAIDGNEFIGCTFRDAKLVYLGGPFELRDCRAEGLGAELRGAAFSALEFIRMLHKLDPSSLAAFIPEMKAKPQRQKIKRANKKR